MPVGSDGEDDVTATVQAHPQSEANLDAPQSAVPRRPRSSVGRSATAVLAAVMLAVLGVMAWRAQRPWLNGTREAGPMSMRRSGRS